MPINVNQNKREAFKVSLATFQSTDCETLRGIQLKLVSIDENSDESCSIFVSGMRLTTCQAMQWVPDFQTQNFDGKVKLKIFANNFSLSLIGLSENNKAYRFDKDVSNQETFLNQLNFSQL